MNCDGLFFDEFKPGETIEWQGQFADPANLPDGVTLASVACSMRLRSSGVVYPMTAEVVDAAACMFRVSALPVATVDYPVGTYDVDVRGVFSDSVADSSPTFIVTCVERITDGS